MMAAHLAHTHLLSFILTVRVSPHSWVLTTGYQALMMAPTELLAEQHYAALTDLAEKLPIALRPRTALVTSCLKPKVCVCAIQEWHLA